MSKEKIMISNIGLKAISDCISKHPYILTEGEHISHVSSNLLSEQINFYNLKNKITDDLYDCDAKKAVNKTYIKYWEAYGMLRGTKSVIEKAIQKGLRLNYEALFKEIDKFINNNDYIITTDFIANFETLRQLSEVKLIESKLLALYEKEIKDEIEGGHVAILQGITSTTDFIYAMYPTGLSSITNLMQNINSEEFFKKNEKGKIFTKEIEKTREEALGDYLSIPTQLMDEMFVALDELDFTEDEVQELVTIILTFVDNLDELNVDIAEAFRESVQPTVDNESQQYEISDKKREDDYSIQ